MSDVCSSDLASGGGEATLILDTRLKGLHRGVGLERVMVAVLADQQTRFKVRCAVGEGTETWIQGFVLPADQPEQPNVFSYALRHRQSLWMGVPASYNLTDLVTHPLRQWFGNRSEEHTSELQSLMRNTYAGFRLIKKND